MSESDKNKEVWRGYKKILLPLGHKADINNLTELASLVIDEQNGMVMFIHVMEQGSYATIPKEWREGAKRVTESHNKMMTYGISSKREVITSKSIVRGILETSYDIEAEAIIMGWGPKPGKKISKMASKVMDGAHGDVLIYKNRVDLDQVQKIMYPLAKEPAESRLRLIKLMVDKTGADLTLVHYIDNKTGSRSKAERVLERAVEKAEGFDLSPDKLVVEGYSLAQSLGEASKDFDLLVLGPSKDWWVYQTLFGKKTDKIAEAAGCSVLLHKHPVEE